MLFSLPALEVLNMNQNSVAMVPVASASVKHLLLDDNMLASFPINIVECRNLLSLHLERNGLRKVPAEISQLSHLRVLRLGGNAFDELPEEVSELGELRQLVLNDTSIKYLPPQMEQLKRLNTLKLDNTQMDGGWMTAYREGVPAVLQYSRTVQLGTSAQKAGMVDADATKADAQTVDKADTEQVPPDGVLVRVISECAKPVEEIDAPRGSPAVERRIPTELPTAAAKADTDTATDTPKGSPAFNKVRKHLLRKHARHSPAPEKGLALHGSPALERRPTSHRSPTLEKRSTAHGSPALERRLALQGSPALERRPTAHRSPVPNRRGAQGVLLNGSTSFADSSKGSPRLMKLRSRGFSGVRLSDPHPSIVVTTEASPGLVTSPRSSGAVTCQD